MSVIVVQKTMMTDAAPGINKTINFQGKMTDDQGLNVADGNYQFVFRLYTVASAGSAVWTETVSLDVADGIFQHNLGSTAPLPGSVDFNTDNIFLGITFNSDPDGEMTPRIQLTASPYAFNSDQLDGLDASDFVQLSPSLAQTGAINVTGNVTSGAVVQGSRLVSTVATGTAPLTVASTTVVANFNADLLDGQQGSFYQNVDNITGGVLGVAYGGTGATTAQGAINTISGLTTNGDLLYHNGTNATRLARGSTNQCLTSSSTTILWGSCGGSSLFTDSGSHSYLTSTTDELVIGGTASLGAKLSIVGTANQPQLLVRGSSTQTSANPMILFQDSGGTEMLRVSALESTSFFIGYQAGLSNTPSGLSDGRYNIGIGSNSLMNNTTGAANVALGASTLTGNITGMYNTAIGHAALGIGNGEANTALGAASLVQASDLADNNVALGFYAGMSVSNGSNNVLVGAMAGNNITTGSNNIVIGYNLGAASATGSNQLNIAGILTSSNYTSGNLVIGASDTTGQQLVLDAKTDTGDPTGANGGMYYNSNFGKFRCYEDGAWVDCINTTVTPNAVTYVVAANDSPAHIKATADYVADGTSDEDEINAALTAGAGGRIYLAEGTYVADGTILIPNNTTLEGAGAATVIEIADIDVTDNLVEATGTNRTGQTIRNLTLDGRNDLNTAGSQNGISFSSVGATTPHRTGGTVDSVTVQNFRSTGVSLFSSHKTTITGNTITGNNYGINTYNSNNNTVSNNTVSSNTTGIYLHGSNNTVTGNTTSNNTNQGIYLVGSGSAVNNTVTGNTSSGNNYGIYLASVSNNTITGNTVNDNTNNGIHLNFSHNNIVSSNIVHNNGGTSANSGIQLLSSDNNQIIGNQITDTAGTSYAINVSGAGNDGNYLADNTFSGTGASSIGNTGTGTVYGVQQDGSGGMLLTGNFLPSSSDAYNLGSDTARWKDLWLGGETIHIGTSTTDEATIGYDTTNNVLQFGTDSITNGNIAFFGDQLHLDKSTGNVGIGTATPQAKLHISGDPNALGRDWTARTAAESNQWYGIAYGNGLFVAVSDNGTNRVMTSPDGITWTPRTVEANAWRSVTYGNGLFVAVAITGTNRVMTSPDGITWTPRSAEASGWMSVTYGNGLFVAVATSGTNRVMTSPDGITWTARTAAQANSWQSVTYGNGLFVAVSDNGTNRVMTSPDGITWTARSAAENNGWISVTYGNGLFVAVAYNGTNRVMTSPDGITWTARSAAENNGWISVTYGNGLFVAVAYNAVMTSPDGITWTARSAAAGSWLSVTYGNGLFVAAGVNSVVMTSGTTSLRVEGDSELEGNLTITGNSAITGTLDVGSSPNSGGATNWTARTAAEANSWHSVTYGNGLFVAVAPSGTNRVMTSPDGITWTPRSAEASSWYSVTYGNGLFVAVAQSGTNRVMTSPDGINWTARTAAEANSWNSVTYGNGLFVAVAINGTNQVMTSPDGINWTARTAAEANSWNSVTYGNGLFVAVAYIGTNQVMTSPDGITWTPRTAAVSVSTMWWSVTYGNGLFVAVAASAGSGNERVMTSPDGITWTVRSVPEANGWWSVTYGNGQFVAVATSGTNRVMTSPFSLGLRVSGSTELNGRLAVASDLQVTGLIQGASINISGNGYFGGNVGVGTDNPAQVGGTFVYPTSGFGSAKVLNITGVGDQRARLVLQSGATAASGGGGIQFYSAMAAADEKWYALNQLVDGDLAFQTIADDGTFGSTHLLLDRTTGNLMLGNAGATTAKLYVYNTSSSSSAGLYVNNADAGNTAGAVTIRNHVGEGIIIYPHDTAPRAAISVRDNTGAYLSEWRMSGEFRAPDTGIGHSFLSDIDTGLGRSGADQLTLYTANVDRLTINSAGNITVNGSIADADGRLVLAAGGADATSYVQVDSQSNNYGFLVRESNNSAGGWLNMYHDGTYSYLADQTAYTGYFLRGNGADVDVRGSLNTGGAYGFTNNTVGDKLNLYSTTYGIGMESSTLTNWSAIQFRWRVGGTSVSTGTQRMLLTASSLTIYGTSTCVIGSGTGNTACTSDARKKHDISTLQGNLEKINQLNPVSYYWNNDPGNTTQRIGLIAQDVKTLFPEAVGMDDEGYYTLDYAVLVAPLIGATQELSVKVEDNASTISVIEDEIAVISASVFGNSSAASTQSLYSNLANRVGVLEQGNFSALTVSGSVQIGGNLTVAGVISAAQLNLSGKLVTSGAQPVGTVLGTSTADKTVAVSGNDTAGEVSLVLAENAISASGEQLSIQFVTAFGAKPRVNLTPISEAAAQVRYYVEPSESGFKLFFIDAPLPGETYSFNYFAVE